MCLGKSSLAFEAGEFNEKNISRHEEKLDEKLRLAEGRLVYVLSRPGGLDSSLRSCPKNMNALRLAKKL